MAKSHLKPVTPTTVKRTVAPKRPPNADLRTREYLTEAEVERLMNAAKGNRWGHRDATMILMAYRHGLRASELVDLRWDQVEFRTGTLHVRRVKQGTPSTHPVLGDELRALRRLQREQEPKSPFVFISERGAPLAPQGLLAWLSGRAGRLSWRSRRTRICLGTPVGSPWPTRATIRAPCKLISATATFSTRCVILSCHRRGSGISGAADEHDCLLLLQ